MAGRREIAGAIWFTSSVDQVAQTPYDHLYKHTGLDLTYATTKLQNGIDCLSIIDILHHDRVIQLPLDASLVRRQARSKVCELPIDRGTQARDVGRCSHS